MPGQLSARPPIRQVRAFAAAASLAGLMGASDPGYAQQGTSFSDQLNHTAKPDVVPEPSWDYTNVYFVSDRRVNEAAASLPNRGKSDAYDDYMTNQYSSITRLGQACVTFPTGRKPAEQNYAEIGDSEVPALYMAVKRIEFYAYPDDLNVIIAGGNRKFREKCPLTQGGADENSLLFIHGWRTSFIAGITRGSQLKQDLQRSTVLVVSWPSDQPGSTMGSYDKAAAEEVRSAYLMPLGVDILRGIDHKLPSVIAHSMGALLYADGLKLMRSAMHGSDGASRFPATVLAAPDIDKASFEKQIGEISPLLNSWTVYCGLDIALLSSGLRHWDQRLGFCGPSSIASTTPEPMVQVEGHFEDTWRHSYFLSAPEMIKDMKGVLTEGEQNKMDTDVRLYHSRHLRLD